jgi:hypothetical protein
MNSDKIRPSRWWYGLAATILIIGFMCWCIVFFALFFYIEHSPQQAIVPGIHRLELPTSGTYVIYYEYQSIVDGKTFSTSKDLALGLKCSVQTLDGTEEIAVSSTSPNATYNYRGKRKGVSIFKFKIAHPGTYILTGKYDNGTGKPIIVLGVTRALIEQILVPGLLLMLLSTVSILLSAGIFWVTFFKRRKAKKRLLQSGASD